jgi:hypothetical protein
MDEKNLRDGKVRITDHYYYTVDGLGNIIPYWIGVKEKMELGKNGKGTGEFREVCEGLGFYSSLEATANACMRDAGYRKIDAGEIQTIKQHIDELRRVKDEIKDALGGY